MLGTWLSAEEVHRTDVSSGLLWIWTLLRYAKFRDAENKLAYALCNLVVGQSKVLAPTLFGRAGEAKED